MAMGRLISWKIKDVLLFSITAFLVLLWCWFLGIMVGKNLSSLPSFFTPSPKTHEAPTHGAPKHKPAEKKANAKH